MRNYFIILFCFTTFVAQSQSIQLLYNNNIADDTITIAVENKETKHYIDLVNTSGTDIQLKVNRNTISLLSGAENAFCFGSCFLPNVDETIAAYTFLAGDTLKKDDITHFYTLYNPHGGSGTSIIKYNFYDVDNPLNRASVVFKFVSEGVGICNPKHEIVSTFEAYPNPTNSNVTIKHNFTNTNVENVQIVLSSLTGAVIETINVNPSENETTLDISNLSQGIYFYSLQANGKTSVTKKLVVK